MLPGEFTGDWAFLLWKKLQQMSLLASSLYSWGILLHFILILFSITKKGGNFTTLGFEALTNISTESAYKTMMNDAI